MSRGNERMSCMPRPRRHLRGLNSFYDRAKRWWWGGLQSEYRIFIDQRERRPIKAVMGKGLIRQDVRMLPTGDRLIPSALIRGHATSFPSALTLSVARLV